MPMPMLDASASADADDNAWRQGNRPGSRGLGGAGWGKVAPASRAAAPPGGPARACHRTIEPYSQRTIEWFGLEGTLKDLLVQPPCHGQGQLSLDQVAQNHI